MCKLFLIILAFPLFSSAQSPMFKLIPKKASSGPTIYLQDLFTGTNGDNLTAHTMDVGSGWTKSLNGQGCGAAINVTIQSNQAQPAAGTQSIYWADAGFADVVASVDMIVPNVANYAGSLVFRYSDCDNYWQVGIERDGAGTPYMYIVEVQSGTASVRATVNVPGATNTTLNIKVTLSGNSIVALVGTSETCNYSSSFNNTATKFGLWGYDSGAYTPAVPFDNFLVIQ